MRRRLGNSKKRYSTGYALCFERHRDRLLLAQVKVSRSSKLQDRMPLRVARVVFAAALLVAFLASSFPLTTTASAPLCTLACCASRAPHASGSCMNGSCHAFLRGRSKTRIQGEMGYTEKFCGLPRLSEFNRLFSSTAHHSAPNGEGPAKQIESNQDSQSGGMIGRPCDPNCGGALFSFATQGRSRHFSATACADKPRPHSVSQRQYVGTRPRKLGGFALQVNPRGPPVLIS